MRGTWQRVYGISIINNSKENNIIIFLNSYSGRALLKLYYV